MRRVHFLLLYMALALGANTAMAELADVADLRDGDMKKLTLHEEPKPVSEIAFTTPDGDPMTLADLQGGYVLLNFWATWCAPCREEMPTLAALQEEFGGDSFQVVTLATGRNSPQGIQKFFSENNISNLPQYRDEKQAVARDMGILGLPITVLIDPEGQEVARLIGDADWHSDSARAIIGALVSGGS